MKGLSERTLQRSALLSLLSLILLVPLARLQNALQSEELEEFLYDEVDDENGGVPSVPLPALAQFPASADPICRRDYHAYITELKTLTLWAAQMFDSNAKLPTGVLYGATHELGNFDQCLSVERKRLAENALGMKKLKDGGDNNGTSFFKQTTTIKGQYCLAQVSINNITTLTTNYISVPPTIWDKARAASEDLSAISRTELHWGVCVPHSCSPEDVQKHLTSALIPLASAIGISPNGSSEGPSYSVVVRSNMCTWAYGDEGIDGKDTRLTSSEIFMCFVIGVFVITLLLASSLELIESNILGQKDDAIDEKGLLLQILRCFSCITNIRRLTSKGNSSGPFAFVNGLKLMTMFLVIFGHRFILNTASPLSNSEYMESLYTRPDALILMGGIIIVVDSFLVVSEYLLVYILLQELNKNERKLSILIIYIHRFFRLTPLYMLVIGFYATLLPRIGDGPLWKSKVGEESEYCRENWWTNFLYINTFVNPHRMCMIQSWFMSVDMHLFMVGVPITFVLHSRPQLGKVLLGGVIICAVVIAFTVTYVQQLDPILLVYFKALQKLREDSTFKYSYIQSYMRALPYFLGMSIGYLVYEAHKICGREVGARSDATLHLSKGMSMSESANAGAGFFSNQRLKPLFCVITVVTSLAPVVGSIAFIHPKHEYNAIAAAIFNPMHRVLWACGMGTIVFAEATGSSYPIASILRWNAIAPLSRMTYSAFLIHVGVQIYSVNTRRVLETSSTYSLISDVIADTSHTYVLAFLFTVIFEAPLLRLGKLILKKARTRLDNSFQISPSEGRNSTVGNCNDNVVVLPEDIQDCYVLSEMPATNSRPSLLAQKCLS